MSYIEMISELKERATKGDIIASHKLLVEAKDLRNELCERCGRYKEAYKGACDGCRYK